MTMMRSTAFLALSFLASSSIESTQAQAIPVPLENFEYEGMWEGIDPLNGVRIQRSFLMTDDEPSFQEYDLMGTAGLEDEACVLTGAGFTDLGSPSAVSYNDMSATAQVSCLGQSGLPVMDAITYEPHSKHILKETSAARGSGSPIYLYRVSPSTRSSC